MSLARVNLRSGDKRRPFGFTMPWHAVREGEDDDQYAFELRNVVSGSWRQYYVRLLVPGRFQNLKGGEKAMSGQRGWCA